jgi:hypothetical protein
MQSLNEHLLQCGTPASAKLCQNSAASRVGAKGAPAVQGITMQNIQSLNKARLPMCWL